MCTWIFAGSVWRGTTCVQNRLDAELPTLNAAACSALPGADSVPSVPGKTQVRSRMHIRQRLHCLMIPVFILTHHCYYYPKYNSTPCAAVFRGLCSNVQPASGRRFGQPARAARI